MIVIDFETAGIDPRPFYPPEPVGVAIKEGKKKGIYGSPDLLWSRWNQGPMIFHNSAFDIAVATEKLGLPMPKPENIHDTQWLAFFDDPHAWSLELKRLAHKHLGMEPDEQTDVKEWVQANVPEAKRKSVNWGYWMSKAPVSLLRPYAIGDVERTAGLFQHFRKHVDTPYYRREQRLLPMLLDNSRNGVRVDLAALKKDLPTFEHALRETDKRICKTLGAKINVGSSEELVTALLESGLGSGFLMTPKGKLSVSKESLAQADLKPAIKTLLNYRGRLETTLTTFLRNWTETAEQAGGRVHFEWSQVRGDGKGARTGRLSSSPNCQNIPKTFKGVVTPKGLPDLPFLRKYLLPDEGHVWVRKDYSQQELRVLAHFEDGELQDMYRENPELDVHTTIGGIMTIERDPAKTIGFGLLYGMGIPELAKRLGVSLEKASKLKAQYLGVLPGLKDLLDDLKETAQRGEPIHTWGGRPYYCEEPIINKFGRLQTFEYKLINYLVQGSSADVTKEAMCRLHEAGLPGHMLVSVHDEIDWSVPIGQEKCILEIDAIMKSIEIDVPMLSDTEVGESWGSLQKVSLADLGRTASSRNSRRASSSSSSSISTSSRNSKPRPR